MARKNVLAARLQEIPKEKARLDEEAKQAQVEMVALDQILEGVSYMEASEMPGDFEELGFRRQIEMILAQHTSDYILPTQIREKMEAAGATGSTPRNLLISIHTILTRLDRDDLIEAKQQNGRTAYRWKGPPIAPLRSLIGLTGKVEMAGPNDPLAGLSTPSPNRVAWSSFGRRTRRRQPLTEEQRKQVLEQAFKTLPKK